MEVKKGLLLFKSKSPPRFGMSKNLQLQMPNQKYLINSYNRSFGMKTPQSQSARSNHFDRSLNLDKLNHTSYFNTSCLS